MVRTPLQQSTSIRNFYEENHTYDSAVVYILQRTNHGKYLQKFLHGEETMCFLSTGSIDVHTLNLFNIGVSYITGPWLQTRNSEEKTNTKKTALVKSEQKRAILGY